MTIKKLMKVEITLGINETVTFKKILHVFKK